MARGASAKRPREADGVIETASHDLNDSLGVVLWCSSLAVMRLGALAQQLAEREPRAAGEIRAVAASLDDVIASATIGCTVVASLAALTRPDE